MLFSGKRESFKAILFAKQPSGGRRPRSRVLYRSNRGRLAARRKEETRFQADEVMLDPVPPRVPPLVQPVFFIRPSPLSPDPLRNASDVSKPEKKLQGNIGSPSTGSRNFFARFSIFVRVAGWLHPHRFSSPLNTFLQPRRKRQEITGKYQSRSNDAARSLSFCRFPRT